MDEHQKEEEHRTSAETSCLSRSEKILQAASPYLDSSTFQILESIVRMSDFMETIQNLRRNPPSLSFMKKGQHSDDILSMTNLGFSSGMDVEGLLRSIRPFCTAREGSMIDQIMSFFNIRRCFSMYQNISNMMSMMNMGQNFNPGNMNGDFSQMMNMASMMSQMNSSMQSNNDFSSNQGVKEPTDFNEEPAFTASTLKEPETEQTPMEPSSAPNYSGFDTKDTYWNSHSYSDHIATDSDQKPSPHEASETGTNNQQMFDLLSSVIPSEQKGTLEAMKLLIESGFIK